MTDPTDRPSRRRKAFVAIVVTVIAIAIYLFARSRLDLERLIQLEQQLRASIQDQPWTAWALGFCIYTLISIFPGTSGKSIICGWLFGFWQSLLMVTLSLTAAGLIGFGVSRYLLQDVVERWIGSTIRALDRHLDEDGAFYMLTLRMLHVPFTLVNYAAGATTLPASTFAWTTCVGLIPSTAIFVGLGDGLPTLERLAEEGAKGLLSWPLAAALVLMGIVPWLLRLIIRRLRPDRPGVLDTDDLVRPEHRA